MRVGGCGPRPSGGSAPTRPPGRVCLQGPWAARGPRTPCDLGADGAGEEGTWPGSNVSLGPPGKPMSSPGVPSGRLRVPREGVHCPGTADAHPSEPSREAARQGGGPRLRLGEATAGLGRGTPGARLDAARRRPPCAERRGASAKSAQARSAPPPPSPSPLPPPLALLPPLSSLALLLLPPLPLRCLRGGGGLPHTRGGGAGGGGQPSRPSPRRPPPSARGSSWADARRRHPATAGTH